MLEVPDYLAISFFKSYVGGVVESRVHKARCVICGDSQKNKHKKRLYLLKHPQMGFWYLYCQNCDSSVSIINFVKQFYPEHYDNFKRECIDYTMKGKGFTKSKTEEEQFIEQLQKIQKKREDRTEVETFIKKECIPLDPKCDIPDKRDIIREQILYLLNRRIKKSLIRKMHYCIGTRYPDRIIIPFFNDKNVPYYFQARSTNDKQQPKYINWSDPDLEDWEKVGKPEYNEFHVDKSKDVFIVEGLFDSTFVNNAVSTLGVKMSDYRYEYLINKYPNRVFIMDNDKDGWKVTKDLLEKGERCVLFPQEYRDIKDLNDISVMTKTNNLTSFVEQHTYQGKKGLLKMMDYRINNEEKVFKKFGVKHNGISKKRFGDESIRIG